MGRAILMSIHPEWIEKIREGKKTLEIRKSVPALMYEPFKVYMYCTKPEQQIIQWVHKGDDLWGEPSQKNFPVATYKNVNAGMWVFGKWGMCVGEFRCVACNFLDRDSVGWGTWMGGFKYLNHEPRYPYCACLTDHELDEYNGVEKERPLCGWRISDVCMYETPIPLENFYRYADGGKDIRPCQNGKPCEYSTYDYGEDCEACAIDFDGENCPFLRVQRPPQSWMYVEEVEV